MTYANKKEMKNILSDAHDLLEDEESWCKHHFAEDAEGKLTAPEADNAERWCMVGAVQRAGLRRGASLALLHATGLLLQANVGHRTVPSFNDDPNTTHQMVLDKMQQAMERL